MTSLFRCPCPIQHSLLVEIQPAWFGLSAFTEHPFFFKYKAIHKPGPNIPAGYHHVPAPPYDINYDGTPIASYIYAVIFSWRAGNKTIPGSGRGGDGVSVHVELVVEVIIDVVSGWGGVVSTEIPGTTGESEWGTLGLSE